ncbi:hypothetical protein EKE94_18415 [Mesobaculum littorinae]|uniref:Uncharacterized protein n=1 Tax=Mesobaculum littorinae TaxID=2486419 RepID=A0A438ACS3_9RHOB|nr:hypothetical protein [Mesobaculum littorinae]RVV96497.1 hypothetical protein EKE94_18415 [Mesobaculum littorinae]
MSYQTGIFARKEADRQKLRDTMRDQFFAEIGIPRLTDPLRIDIDPVNQHAAVLRLVEIAQTTHKGDMGALNAMKTELFSSAFGIPTLPIGVPNQLSLADIMPEQMEKSHHAMDWAGWFGD